MTTLALLAQLAIVGIILFVAIDALARCLAEFLSLLMTTLAAYRLVLADQTKISPAMIKTIPIQVYDFGISALVITVASLAGLHSGLRMPAMEAFLATDIGIDLFVAIKTQPTFRYLSQSTVTLFAIAIPFAVPFDQIAGREQPFKIQRQRALHVQGQKRNQKAQNLDQRAHQ